MKSTQKTNNPETIRSVVSVPTVVCCKIYFWIIFNCAMVREIILKSLTGCVTIMISITETDQVPLECCSCSEGVELQINFINHLLSHQSAVKERISQDADMLSLDQREEFTHEQKKTKPSYNNRFNRKDRSPETQKLQLNFTFDESSKLFHCNFCRNGYKHKQTVERHLVKEHDSRKSAEQANETLLFYCTICPKNGKSGYKHKQTLQRHLEKEHNIKKEVVLTTNKSEIDFSFEQAKLKSLSCDICGRSFMLRESLRKHLLSHTSSTGTKLKSDVGKIICHLCPAEIRRDQIKRHLKNIHEQKQFVCQEPGCSTTLSNDSSKMTDHQNWHLKIKNYSCEFCQEEFYFASNLRQHLYRHVDPEKYKCQFCSECFVSRGSLSNHLRSHNPSIPKTIKCEHENCNKSFRFDRQLKQHIFNVHRSELEQKCKM